MSTAPWSFIAMQYYGLILNRTYRVYVTDLYLCGARVHGLIASPSFPNPAWNNPEFYVKPRLAAKYDQIDVTTPALLSADRANFRIPRHTIVQIDSFPTKWGMGVVPYSGRLVIHTSADTHHEFILLGIQDRETIRRWLMA